jgi:hypothetical protein
MASMMPFGCRELMKMTKPSKWVRIMAATFSSRLAFRAMPSPTGR